MSNTPGEIHRISFGADGRSSSPPCFGVDGSFHQHIPRKYAKLVRDKHKIDVDEDRNNFG